MGKLSISGHLIIPYMYTLPTSLVVFQYKILLIKTKYIPCLVDINNIVKLYSVYLQHIHQLIWEIMFRQWISQLRSFCLFSLCYNTSSQLLLRLFQVGVLYEGINAFLHILHLRNAVNQICVHKIPFNNKNIILSNSYANRLSPLIQSVMAKFPLTDHYLS